MPHEGTTIEKIINSLRELQITKITEQIYVNGNVDKLADAICEQFKISFNSKFLRKKYLNSLMN